MKMFKCIDCEKTFESDKAICTNKFKSGEVCGSDDVIELNEINRYSNDAYTNRLFREGQASY